uniref:alpha-1,6-mannosyl-glycoprotein 6-beta-N-acetylglucosaminyltransferase n=1 Tax=Syphacia muris TaxID=451379 RepID=A0A0N5APP3_9BILA
MFLELLVDEMCGYRYHELTSFTSCKSKMHWMQNGWLTHRCYSEYGVNGSVCSFAIYLSEVEKYCPRLYWRKKRDGGITKSEEATVAIYRLDVDKLFKLMVDSDVNYVFIKSRILRIWPKFKKGLKLLNFIGQQQSSGRRKLKILLHLGFLTKEAGFKFGQKASSGGPLGELVQWSDLISVLYMLGHDLKISTENASFRSNLKPFISESPCPDRSIRMFDLLFTDIVGLRYMRKNFPNFYNGHKCLFRVLDSFGSHAEFNIASYFKKHREELGGGPNPWGGNQLNLQQFMTMYPHTDDNTFLGFVVDEHLVNQVIQRDNSTLVYGKEFYMWKNADSVLKVVSQLSHLHATVADVKNFGNYAVENHGLLSGTEFHSLLQRVKIFLGLGFPLEGPAPLEAIASGAIFINPKFVPPKSRRTYQFFRDKPTLRELTSQNPYAEKFIGKPCVITVDINDPDAITSAVKEALNTKLNCSLPFEFTPAGMLQRVDVLINKQNFCSAENPYPPESALNIRVSKNGASCQRTCADAGLVCERSFFRLVNVRSVMNRLFKCKTFNATNDPLAPFSCTLQIDSLLFSCASEAYNTGVKRICPCRNYIKGQVALCSECL